MRNLLLFGLLLACFVTACVEPTKPVDVVFRNGNIYTVNENQPWVRSVAVADGRIVAISEDSLTDVTIGPDTEVIDLGGRYAMPGLIEGHAHLSNLGEGRLTLNFLEVTSWDSIVSMVAAAAAEAEPGEWITGRGWHQEKWTARPDRHVHGYPYHDVLSALTPDNPVLLRHASGHAAFANAGAMAEAGISIETPDPAGGEIVRGEGGRAIGVFEERAMQAVYAAYDRYVQTLPPETVSARWREGIELAQQHCLAHGITSFQDAGSSVEEIDKYARMAEAGELDLRLYAMLREDLPTTRTALQRGTYPLLDVGDGYFTCRAIKTELDGALGSYGAWLLEPYADKAGFLGQNTTEISTVEAFAQLCREHDLQLCVHAIGDRANRETLDLMERAMRAKPGKTDLRWRIEHSQHLHPDDIPRFDQLSVIASMQAIHCTSDSPFVIARLGEERARTGAYPWRALLDAGAVVTNGTDAPVEAVDPLPSLYATVTRKRLDGGPAFFPEQALTRAEALRSYTLANAYAAFQEADKGSVEVGKYADLVVFDTDLLRCADEEIPGATVLATYVGGRAKYQHPDFKGTAD